MDRVCAVKLASDSWNVVLACDGDAVASLDLVLDCDGDAVTPLDLVLECDGDAVASAWWGAETVEWLGKGWSGKG